MSRHTCRLQLPCDQRGGVLVFALILLVGLTVLALALLSVGALEPQISRNHADMVRARYLAEAGIEHGYDILAADRTAWSMNLAGSTCAVGVVLGEGPLPGHPASDGLFRVLVRNDCDAGDERLTGVTPDSGIAESNGIVILVATGSFRDVVHRMTTIVSDDSRRPAGPGQTVPTPSIRAYNWSDQ